MTSAVAAVVVVRQGEGAVRGRRAPGRRALWAASRPAPSPSAPRPLSTGQLPPPTSRAAATHGPAEHAGYWSPPGEAVRTGLRQLKGWEEGEPTLKKGNPSPVKIMKPIKNFW